MSNLGWYQEITRIAKKVGGPKNLLAITAVLGYSVIRTGEAGVKHLLSKRKKNNPLKTYIATSAWRDDQGFSVKPGDEILVLEKDGDAILIAIPGDENSPYFISEELLRKITE